RHVLRMHQTTLLELQRQRRNIISQRKSGGTPNSCLETPNPRRDISEGLVIGRESNQQENTNNSTRRSEGTPNSRQETPNPYRDISEGLVIGRESSQQENTNNSTDSLHKGTSNSLLEQI
ncbi:6387_t:CDS:1, partial [Gigaspora margarita]